MATRRLTMDELRAEVGQIPTRMVNVSQGLTLFDKVLGDDIRFKAFRQESTQGWKPDGNRWPPLADETVEQEYRGAPRGPEHILFRSGELYRSIGVKVLPTSIELSATATSGSYAYGTAHQYGTKRKKPPKRVFLAVSPQRLKQISRVLSAYIMRGLAQALAERSRG